MLQPCGSDGLAIVMVRMGFPAFGVALAPILVAYPDRLCHHAGRSWSWLVDAWYGLVVLHGLYVFASSRSDRSTATKPPLVKCVFLPFLHILLFLNPVIGNVTDVLVGDEP